MCLALDILKPALGASPVKKILVLPSILQGIYLLRELRELQLTNMVAKK